MKFSKPLTKIQTERDMNLQPYTRRVIDAAVRPICLKTKYIVVLCNSVVPSIIYGTQT